MVDADISTLVKNFTDGISRMRRMTDSSVVLAAAAILDNRLEIALKKSMKPQSKTLYKRLFESPDAPLNTFSSKIIMARALDIITVEIFLDLEKIRCIRNKFAHSADVLHFESREIAPLFLSLKKPNTTHKNPAVMFMAYVNVINDALKAYLGSTNGGTL
jgi:hypothetical protein